MAEEHKRTIELGLTLPGSGYSYEIEEVRLVNGELWAVSRVKASGIGTAALTPSKATANVVAPIDVSKAKVRQFVYGKSWTWTEKIADTVHLGPTEQPPPSFAKAPTVFKRESPAEKKGEVSLWIFGIHENAKLDEEDARKLVAEHHAGFKQHLGAIGMFFAHASESQARKIAEHPAIKFVEKDQ